MRLNSGEFVIELLKHYKTRNISRAVKKLAKDINYSERTIYRLLFENTYSKDLLITVALFLNITPENIFIKDKKSEEIIHLD